MGTAEGPARLSYAAGRPASDSRLARFAVTWLGEEFGGTAIEYAMVASMISIVIFAAVGQIGDKVKAFFESMVAPNV
ncbi:MAG: Flp family type IVb pilin [Alphaproteobacteria bacterium]|nr:Flp family type IVb pilin [Alphaproteobacteria bacterium]